MEPAICYCKNLSSFTTSPSPFSKIIGLHWFDGLVMGVAQCVRCLTAYKLDTLAIDFDGKYDRAAWDSGEELRAFSLALLPSQAFEQLTAIFSAYGEPTWPVWWPRWDFTAEENKKAAEQLIEQILAGAAPPEFVLAAHNLNLYREIVSARRVSVEELRSIQKDVWFQFLGFIRESGPI